VDFFQIDKKITNARIKVDLNIQTLEIKMNYKAENK
jgi:hypothetical protein